MIEVDKKITDYYYNEFLSKLAPACDDVRKITEQSQDSLLNIYEKYYQLTFPEELSALFKAKDRAEDPYFSLYEFRVWMEDTWLADPKGANTFFQIAEVEQKAFLSTLFMQFSCNYIPIGTAGNGDQYFAFTAPVGEKKPVVLLYDHETGDLPDVFSDSIATLAFLNEQFSDEKELTKKQCKNNLKLLEKRVAPSWHYEEKLEELGVQCTFEDQKLKDWVAIKWYLNYWTKLLLSYDFRTPHALEWYETLRNDTFDAINLELINEKGWLKETSWSLHFLHRFFWLKEEKKLQDLMDELKDHKSPLVIDTIESLQQFLGGNPKLYDIPDILEYRESFLASIGSDKAKKGAKTFDRIDFNEISEKRNESLIKELEDI